MINKQKISLDKISYFNNYKDNLGHKPKTDNDEMIVVHAILKAIGPLNIVLQNGRTTVKLSHPYIGSRAMRKQYPFIGRKVEVKVQYNQHTKKFLLPPKGESTLIKLLEDE